MSVAPEPEGSTPRSAPLREALVHAIVFLTRVPLRAAAPTPSVLGRAVVCFPIVGAAVGGLCALAYVGANALLTPVLAAIVAVVVATLATGALHEDGFADCADAFGGASNRERALEIMKDPRVGAYGAIALVLLLQSKVATLAWLGEGAPTALVAAHALSRASAAPLLLALPYVTRSTGGRGAGFAGTVDTARAVTTVALALAIGIIALGPGIGAIATAVALGITFIAGVYFRARLGGINGDCLGACNQVVEIAVLLVSAICTS